MITLRGRQPGLSIWLDANLHHLNDTQKGSSVTLGARSLSTFTKKKGSSLPLSYLRGRHATRKSKGRHVDRLGSFLEERCGNSQLSLWLTIIFMHNYYYPEWSPSFLRALSFSCLPYCVLVGEAKSFYHFCSWFLHSTLRDQPERKSNCRLLPQRPWASG